MSTDNEDSSTLPLPGLSSDHPANAGIITGDLAGQNSAIVLPVTGPRPPALHQLRDLPPLDWSGIGGEEQAPGKMATERAGFEEAKGRVIDADPRDLNDGAGFAQDVARQERAAKKLAAAPAQEAAQAKPARRTRAAKAKTAAEDVQDKAGEARPKRTSTTRATRTAKATGTPEQGVPAATDNVPPITPEAIDFLADPDATAADMFKLSPESQTFVQYHLKYMADQEANSRLTEAYLLANSRPVSPAFQQFVDALAKVGKDSSAPDKQSGLAAASFAPKPGTIAAFAPAPVEYGKMDIWPDDITAKQPIPEAVTEAENSIERSRVLQATATQAHPGQGAADVEATSQSTLTAPVSASVEAVAPFPRARLGKRLLQVIGGATQKAGTWISEQGKDASMPAPAPPEPLARAASATLAVATDPKANVVPEAVARRFLKVEQDYYFPDKTHAFSDRGEKLATRGHHPEVVRALVDVAKARGWDRITVKGTNDFRRSAWLEAAQSGLKVAGYQATALDLVELSQCAQRNSVKKGISKEKTATQPTAQQAAVDAAQVTPAQTTVAVQTGAQAALAPGTTKPDPALVAKAKSFENEKPTFVAEKFPELAGAYGIVEAAKAFAAEHLPESARNGFVGLARRHVIAKIVAGQQINGPKVYLAPAKDKGSHGLAKAQTADLGKPSHAKEQAKDR